MSTAFESHYTPQQLARMWSLSSRTVRRWFEDYPGVLRLGYGRRTVLRIPASVAERFHQNRTALRGKVQLRRRIVK